MTLNFVARDTLYRELDKLILFNINNNKKLPLITLDAAQHELFSDFNDKIEGELYYRNIKVRRQ